MGEVEKGRGSSVSCHTTLYGRFTPFLLFHSWVEVTPGSWSGRSLSTMVWLVTLGPKSGWGPGSTGDSGVRGSVRDVWARGQIGVVGSDIRVRSWSDRWYHTPRTGWDNGPVGDDWVWGFGWGTWVCCLTGSLWIEGLVGDVWIWDLDKVMVWSEP